MVILEYSSENGFQFRDVRNRRSLLWKGRYNTGNRVGHALGSSGLHSISIVQEQGHKRFDGCGMECLSSQLANHLGETRFNKKDLV